ncbi:MAG: acetate--CoA ligase [Sediminibacterium sp.]|nr:acetate--CoA ligase [Sediminibacterium sp.]
MEYENAYKKSIENPELFWDEIAQHFIWKKKYDKILDWNFSEPKVKWFEGGILNITENCLDRIVEQDPQRIAIKWEPNSPFDEPRVFSYQLLFNRVCEFSESLKRLGVQKGERVVIYMGMVPELVIAVLACARMGAIHSVIFGGFSANSIKDRIADAQAEFIITCDGTFRGNKIIDLKSTIDEAIKDNPTIKKVIVYKRTQNMVNMVSGRDIWWDEALARSQKHFLTETNYPLYQAEPMQSEDPLFILYTSGSTGKPKGVVHTCAGYMIYTHYSFVNVFNYKPGDLFFSTADIGWITGHTYTIYGPLSAGASLLMYEGIPTWPDAGRFWEIIDKYKAQYLYTAPTAIRLLMTYGTEIIMKYKLDSLKVIGSVGEPINEEAWHWYNIHIGKNKCPIVDTWWQTETGATMISNMAFIHEGKPGWATYPLPGVQPLLVDEQGQEVKTKNADGYYAGNLCIKFPWPSILRTTFNDHERCRKNYFSIYKNLYFTGDGAYKNELGQYRITGRVDDVINVSGHRIGSAEVENALNSHLGVVESAVVGFPHPIKGQGIYAFIIFDYNSFKINFDEYSNENLSSSNTNEKKLINDINSTVSKTIGSLAKPDFIQIVNGLPKTRSGKIMRRILRKIAENDLENIGDTSTLLDPEIVSEIIKGRKH